MKLEDRPTQIAPGTADLVTCAQKGEEWAFEALFEQHKQRVYSLCLRMIGNTADAEELTQEAFLQVFRKIHTFRGESTFSTWLHRVSANTVLMRLRKKTVNVMPLEDSARGEECDEAPREFGARDLVLAGAIDRMNLERAMAKLPFGYRQAFVLHDVQGYQHNEIAALLGCSIGNSKSQVHKARLRLRKLLQETRREFRQPKTVHAEVVSRIRKAASTPQREPPMPGAAYRALAFAGRRRGAIRKRLIPQARIRGTRKEAQTFPVSNMQ